MRENVQYGKIVRGQLLKAPIQMSHEGCLYCGVPDEVYKEYGYKPIVFTPQPEEVPYGKIPTDKWIENNDSIQQIWSFEVLKEDYAEKLRKGKGRFNLDILHLKNGIDEYCQNKINDFNNALDQDEILKVAYDSLMRTYPGSNISSIMKKYERTIPVDFFSEISLTDYLISVGYHLNYTGEWLFVKSPTVYYLSGSGKLIWKDGKVYENEMGQELTIVTDCQAFKFKEDGSISVLDPMIVCMALKRLSEIEETYVCSNQYYTMAFVYLHTIYEAFFTELIRYIALNQPMVLLKNKEIGSVNILQINNSDEFYELRNEYVDRLVKSIGYLNLQDKIKELKNAGINVEVIQKKYLDDMVQFSEMRNLIVHNGGIVDNITLKKLSKTGCAGKYALGDDIAPDHEMLLSAITLVEELCNTLYDLFRDKFGI